MAFQAGSNRAEQKGPATSLTQVNSGVSKSQSQGAIFVKWQEFQSSKEQKEEEATAFTGKTKKKLGLLNRRPIEGMEGLPITPYRLTKFKFLERLKVPFYDISE